MKLPVVERSGEAMLDLLTDHDFPWICALLDEVDAAAGHPWRDLVERIERLVDRRLSGRVKAQTEFRHPSPHGSTSGGSLNVGKA